jgi:hypothetical protein
MNRNSGSQGRQIRTAHKNDNVLYPQAIATQTWHLDEGDKILGSKTSPQQTVNDKPTKATFDLVPESACAGVRIQSLQSLALWSGQFSLCANPWFNRPQSLEISVILFGIRHKPPWRLSMWERYWGKAELGRWAEAEARKVGKRPKKKSEARLTPTGR